jgi:hypothetical protein
MANSAIVRAGEKTCRGTTTHLTTDEIGSVAECMDRNLLAIVTIASVLSLIPLMADVIKTIGDENWNQCSQCFYWFAYSCSPLVIWQIAIVAATPQVPRSLTTQ